MARVNGQDYKSEQIIFNGKKYNRYPLSKKRELRVYYSRTGGKRLHVAIWEKENGNVPVGFQIHHKDKNPLNNNLSNLECLSASEHISSHMQELVKDPQYLENLQAHCAEIRPLTKEWHRSEDGRKWHSEHGKESYKHRVLVEKLCANCGMAYQTKDPKKSKFCGNNCKS